MKIIKIIFFVFIMIACTKESNDYKSIGIITGVDLTMCGCCGGYIILIDDVDYRIDSFPENSGIDLLNETLPVTVKLDWQLKNTGCPASYNRISIQRIKKI